LFRLHSPTRTPHPLFCFFHRRYHTAVQVGLGKNMEAILVDTDKTAQEGIKYLKEQRVGVATFIPCESVRVDPLRETLRDLGGSVRMSP
jgi:structural maintenance of chromosome 1